VRAALPCFASYSTGGHRRAAAPAPSISWIDLAESLSELTPRFDKRGAPVLSVANHIVARGASQTDCDSVDPSLSAGTPSAGSSDPTRGGGSAGATSRPAHLPPPVGLGRSVVELWSGMPRTAEWEQASLRLNRVLLRGAVGLPAAAVGSASRRAGSHSATVLAAEAAAASRSFHRGVVLSPGPVYPRNTGVSTPQPQPRTLTVASNSTWMVPALEHCVGRCAALLEAKAYLHWYERFGVTAEHVLVAAESVRAAADAYRSVQRLPGTG
jgi:hypothetical protein